MLHLSCGEGKSNSFPKAAGTIPRSPVSTLLRDGMKSPQDSFYIQDINVLLKNITYREDKNISVWNSHSYIVLVNSSPGC